jgi:hypothetical protein
MRRKKVLFTVSCPTCGHRAAYPFRVYDDSGQHVLFGCVDHYHGAYYVLGSPSHRWHDRPDARKIRAAQKGARGGYVFEPVRSVGGVPVV